jgi:outer membrane protein OmpA-like peptidoglycan-associated protein
VVSVRRPAKSGITEGETMLVRICLLAVTLGAAAAYAQRVTPEGVALSHVYSAFMTGTDAGVMSATVALGPELQRRLGLPAQPEGSKAYEALMNLTSNQMKDVRRATPEEIRAYGSRRGFDAAASPVFAVDAGAVQLLVQYDIRAARITYAGQLGVADPDPAPVQQAPAQVPIEVEAVMQALVELPGRPAPAVWTVPFESRSSRLTPKARAVLEELLPKASERRIQVSGHADSLGSAQYNQRLSKRRAEAVRAYLVGHGVDGKRIELFAHGEAQPVKACPEEKKRRALRDCLAPNRRVVVEAL